MHSSPPTPQQPMSAAQAGQQYQEQLLSQCAQGSHEAVKKYGACGIITAVLCFPCGLLCLSHDAEYRCNRCGVKVK